MQTIEKYGCPGMLEVYSQHHSSKAKDVYAGLCALAESFPADVCEKMLEDMIADPETSVGLVTACRRMIKRSSLPRKEVRRAEQTPPEEELVKQLPIDPAGEEGTEVIVPEAATAPEAEDPSELKKLIEAVIVATGRIGVIEPALNAQTERMKEFCDECKQATQSVKDQGGMMKSLTESLPKKIDQMAELMPAASVSSVDIVAPAGTRVARPMKQMRFGMDKIIPPRI